MKRTTPYLIHGVVGVCVISAGAIAGSNLAAPQPEADEKPPHERLIESMFPSDEAGMQEGMERWMAMGTPGAGHEYLQQFVGEYTTVTKLWMDPSAPPAQTPGTASFEMVLDGRFLQQKTTGQLMGREYQGMGFTGYNNGRKLFTSMWMDSMGTGTYSSTGSISPDGKTMTMFGTMDEPLTGEMGKNVMYTTRILSEDSFVFEISEIQYGDPFKVVEITYTRK